MPSSKPIYSTESGAQAARDQASTSTTTETTAAQPQAILALPSSSTGSRLCPDLSHQNDDNVAAAHDRASDHHATTHLAAGQESLKLDNLGPLVVNSNGVGI